MMLRRCTTLITASLALTLASLAGAEPPPPADSDPIAARYSAARELLDAGRLDDAAVAFAELLTDHPDHPTSVYSARLLLDVHNQRGDFPALREWVDRLRADPALLAADPGLAGDLDRIDLTLRRRQAEALERARRYGDCARAYFEIYQRQPSAPQADELLYNAGVCFEADHSLAQALALYQQLIAKFPRSRLVPKALQRTARGYRSIAHFDQAAAAIESYVDRYPGDPEAADGLVDAIVLRRTLGMTARARELTARYAKLYGRKRPRETAQLLYLGLARDEDKGAADRLERYLKEWGRKGSRALQVIAYARLGELLWQRSCPHSDDPLAGCVALDQPPARIPRCAERPRLRARPRDAKLAARARAAFTAAVKSYRALPATDLGPGSPTRAAVDRAFAGALFALAEPDYEAFLDLGFPTGLDFSPDKPEVKAASLERWREFLDRKRALGGAVLGGTALGGGSSSRPGAYAEILALDGRAGPWRTAAAARIATVSAAFASSLAGAEVPADVAREPFATEKIEAFCDEMFRQVEPLEEQAIRAFETCVKLGDRDPERRWLPWCERALTTLRPLDHKRFQERHGGAAALAPILTLEPLADPPAPLP